MTQGNTVEFHIEGPTATRAYVVHLEMKAQHDSDAARSPAAKLEEAIGLALAIDLEVAGSEIAFISHPRPATLFGLGKVTQIADAVKRVQAELVVVNGPIGPGQQRNLEKAWGTKVLERTGLILEIFGRRARTREGSLQVELAHLEYQRTRLVRSWTHLERQRGGFGFLGGPGETQIETDRRLIRERIAKLRRQLGTVKRTRGLHRSARKRVPYPIVALVGYTNAGKSTLFNTLTKSQVQAEDLLFATLDPTMRQLALPQSGRQVILSDTVGFISDLPTTLVAAFHATLEEVLEADLVIHVRDISHPDSAAQSADVHDVLGALGMDDAARERIVEVWNKADLLDDDARAALDARAGNDPRTVLVSALSGEGIGDLVELIGQYVQESERVCTIELRPEQGAELAWLYRTGTVENRQDMDDGGIVVTVRLDERAFAHASQKFGSQLKLPEASEAAE